MSGAAMIAFGRCWLCHAPFTFNPNWVPSVPVDPETGKPPDVDTHHDGLAAAVARAVKQPLCSTCIVNVNRERTRLGQEPIYVSPHAYSTTDSL